MKIRYLSDLYMEFTGYMPSWIPPIGEVVLTGDIGVGVKGIEWAKHAFRGRPVLYVLGNHEFYRHQWDRLIVEARAAAHGTNVRLLEQDRVEIDGVVFLGARLWTDFELYGAERRTESINAGGRARADFWLIEGSDGRALEPPATIVRCEETTRWLAREIEASDLPTVVITHHSSSLANEHPQFVASDLGSCFHSRREDLFRPPVKLWISGHTHHSYVNQVNGIPLLSNQRGCPREGVVFSWDAVVDLQVDQSGPVS